MDGVGASGIQDSRQSSSPASSVLGNARITSLIFSCKSLTATSPGEKTQRKFSHRQI